MKFYPLALDAAAGKILGHNIAASDGQRLLRKGRPLSAEDVALLRRHGHSRVYVAELEPGDISEDGASKRVADAVFGAGLRRMSAGAGRSNAFAERLGVARVDGAAARCVNANDGITLATVLPNSLIQPKQMAATVKIIPYALPESAVRAAVACAPQPVVSVDPLPIRNVAIMLTGLPGARERIEADFDAPLRSRVEAIGSRIGAVEFVSLEEAEAPPSEARLAAALGRLLEAGAEMIILAGETAIMDRADVVPRAIEALPHGRVTCFGAPVDPGNLLMIAYAGSVPIMGAPGCARSRKVNVIDWVLPRLAVGDRLGQSDLSSLGVGGLLEEAPERPMPRLQP